MRGFLTSIPFGKHTRAFIGPITFLLLAGCSDGAGRDYPIVVEENHAGNDFKVVVLAPTYDLSDSPPKVEVFWNDSMLFSDRLMRERYPAGHPYRLIEMHTSAGPHVLKIEMDGDVKEARVEFGPNENLKRFLLHDGGAEGMGIFEELAADVVFF